VGIEKFGFDGKQALVVGGASGMGLAAATLLGELGASVTVADVKEPLADVGPYIPVDLRDEAVIDEFVKGLSAPVHVLLSCAGVADGTPGLPQINFIGQRHLVEAVLDRELLPPGAAIGMIASIGGIAWSKHLDVVGEFLDTPDFDTASKWIEAHPEHAHYAFTKQAMIAYCAREAPALARRQLRINCIAPGPTMTPLMQSGEGWLDFEAAFRAAMDHPGSQPEEQAYPLVFLVSDAASFINGHCLVADLGFTAGGTAGVVESPMLDLMLN
jgi:NAD(P)-dependent dehydrogenase (short-subunit alcohol dehydrogenase family)